MADGTKRSWQRVAPGGLLSEELVGRQFGPLTIATRTTRGISAELEVEVDCSLCGKRGWRRYYRITRRKPRGCEHCLPTFGPHCPEWVWRRVQHQRQRCQCPQNPAYQRYGGRGIQFRFSSTYEGACWVVANLGMPPNRSWTIDRIDNSGHYEPGNLRWATMVTQSRNRDFAWRSHLRQAYPFVLYCDGQLSNLARKGLTPKQIADRWLLKYGTSSTSDQEIGTAQAE